MSDDYERVFGLKFRQPDDVYGLNEETPFNDPFLVLTMLLSCVPTIGLPFVLANLTTGFVHRHDNEFRIDEQFWKAGVIGSVTQVLSVAVYVVVTMV